MFLKKSKNILIAVVFALGISTSSFTIVNYNFDNAKNTIETSEACCKTCSKGKACGDSCIKKSNNCYKKPGCACNKE